MTAPLLVLLLAASPQRIVSTSPSITEILFALGLGDRVAGVTTYCHYPPEARNKPKIGSFIQPDLEAIASLRPDLVIIQKNPIQFASKLDRLALRWLEVDYPSVEQTLNAIERIAEACGEPARGTTLAASLRGQLDTVRQSTSAHPRTTIAFIIGRNANAIDGLFVAGRSSYLSGLIEIAGGTNVFADAAGSYPRITLESLVARNPDVIVDMGDMSDLAAVTQAQRKAVVALWSKQTALGAARNRRVHAVSDESFTMPGPRMAHAARTLALLLHGANPQ